MEERNELLNFYIVKLGDRTTHCCQINGEIYTKLTPILKFIGYTDSALTNSMKAWVGEDLIRLRLGKQDCYFVNKRGVESVLSNTRYTPSYHVLNSIFKDIFQEDIIKDSEEAYMYKYTGIQMLEIYELINEKPIRKDKVLEKLRKGRITL